MNKICTKCKIEQPLTSFHKKKAGLHGVKAECISCCHKWQSEHYRKPENKQKRLKRQTGEKYQVYMRSFKLKAAYGITTEQYDNMVLNQNNACAICKKPEIMLDCKGKSIKRLAVDHDHKTNKVRQLLCSKCNTVLGRSEDSIDLLLSMVDYLKKHS